MTIEDATISDPKEVSSILKPLSAQSQIWDDYNLCEQQSPHINIGSGLNFPLIPLVLREEIPPNIPAYCSDGIFSNDEIPKENIFEKAYACLNGSNHTSDPYLAYIKTYGPTQIILTAGVCIPDSDLLLMRNANEKYPRIVPIFPLVDHLRYLNFDRSDIFNRIRVRFVRLNSVKDYLLLDEQ